jgi:hypothetical protein
MDYLAYGHLTGQNVPTVFSSWTQPFGFITTWACHPEYEYYVSVIDTTRLAEVNVVLYISAMEGLRNGGEGEYDHEYFSFGVITGHRTVSLRQLFCPKLGQGLKQFGVLQSAVDEFPGNVWVPKVDQLTGDLGGSPFRTKKDAERFVRSARALARHFGNELELPMTTHFATCLDHAEEVLGWIKEALAKIPALTEWRAEDRFSAQCWLDYTHNSGQFQDAERAVQVLKAPIEDNHRRLQNPTRAQIAAGSKANSSKHSRTSRTDSPIDSVLAAVAKDNQLQKSTWAQIVTESKVQISRKSNTTRTESPVDSVLAREDGQNMNPSTKPVAKTSRAAIASIATPARPSSDSSSVEGLGGQKRAQKGLQIDIRGVKQSLESTSSAKSKPSGRFNPDKANSGDSKASEDGMRSSRRSRRSRRG